MLHVFWCEEGGLRKEAAPDTWRDLLKNERGLLWVDMEDPTEDEIDLLSDVLNFHPLSVEDCIFPNHRPKIDDYGNYLFIIFHAMALKEGAVTPENLEILELNIYMGPNYLVSFHEDPITIMNQVRTKCSMNPALLSRGPDFLLHLIMDSVVDDMTRILDKLEDKLDVIEDEILADKEGSITAINEFKGIISKFRKVAGPQRDVVRMLMSQTFSFISTHRVIYFKDIHDHLVSINENAALLREVIASTMDTYLSMVSKKMNDVMKVLTVLTAIFMPLNLIAGIGGMSEWSMMTNPENWNRAWWMVSYPVFFLLMALLSAVMWWWFKRLKWF